MDVVQKVVVGNLRQFFNQQKQLPADKQAWQAQRLVLGAAVSQDTEQLRLKAATASLLGVSVRAVNKALLHREQAVHLGVSSAWFATR